jgi:type II secretory pathway component GspD/PulD (secretin)
MKKLFLFLSVSVLALSLNSCSSDSGSGNGSVSLKIGGVSKSFKVETDESFGTVYVYGYRGSIDNPTETIDFQFDTNATGADQIMGITYSNENDSYYDTTLVSNISSNTATAAKGTFSTTLTPFGAGSDLELTEGKFSVKY